MVILGSTGSIGVNTLNIARKYSLDVEVLVAGKNIELLNAQINEFKPSIVVVGDKALKVNHNRVLYGEEGIIEAINLAKSNIVVNALVGFLGLKPTIEAIKLNKTVALANKESLVVAGEFIDISKIRAIDSEHFGLWYLLNSAKSKVERLIISASGGAFRDRDLSELRNVTLDEALKHPNWSMGQKITIDSATMTNKLFEILEAKWLFNINKIDAFIESKSLIHALIEFVDGSTTAHIAKTNMQLPIAFALLDEVCEPILERVDLVKMGEIAFREIYTNRYPIWEIKDELLEKPYLGVVVNGANEVAIELFVNGDIRFLDISKLTLKAFNKFQTKANSLDDIFEIDKSVREYIKSDYKSLINI